MSIKHPTSGGQTHAQRAAVQWTFHLERSSFLSFNTRDKDSKLALPRLYLVHSCTKHRLRLLHSGSETPHINHLVCFHIALLYHLQLPSVLQHMCILV